MRLYMLIQARLASKYELEEHYDLEEALKLYALLRMKNDISAAQADELRRDAKGRR